MDKGLSEETFTVEVTKTETDKIAVKVQYEDDSDEPELRQPAEEFSGRFAKLSSAWTSTAIGFLDVVPFLSAVGYAVADHDMEERTLGLVRKISQHCEVKEENGITTETFAVPMRESQRISKSLAKTSQYVNTAAVMRRSALTALLAEYEAFIADLLSIAIDIRPEVLLDDEARIPLSALSDYETIEELKRAHLKQRLEDLLHKSSHKEVIDWVAKKFGVNLTSNDALIADFVEICQRRHLVSHAGSRANRRYLRICNEAGCKPEKILKLDELVTIDRKYLRRSTARVFQVGFFTLHLLWQKLLNKPDDSDTSVLSCSHDFLENDLTKMARRVTNFSLSRKKDKPGARLNAYLVINEAQSYKFDPDLSDEDKATGIEKTLDKHDWSDRSPLMDLVLACLRDEFDNIEEKVVAASKFGEHKLTYPDVFVYNVFREARENSAFMRGVIEAFGKVGELEQVDMKALPSPEPSGEADIQSD